MSASSLRFGHPAIIPAQARHTATVFFLHGLGDSGQNLSILSRGFNLPHVKWVFPTAPNRPITLNGGMSMPGWFDLYGVDKLMQGEADHEGIKASTEYLGTLVKEEVAGGTPAGRIVVGGFSQGGHVAAKFALSSPLAVPACVMLSTWVEAIRDPVPVENTKTRFWIGHGTSDQMIPATMAGFTENVLKQKGCQNVTRTMYPGMQHSTCMQELDDARDFLLAVIPQEAEKIPTLAEVEQMSVKELRLYLRSKHIDCSSFLEKSEFVAAARQTLQNQ